MNYKLIIPSGQNEMVFSLQFGNITLKNGEVVPKSHLTDNYPDFFYPLGEENVVQQPKIVTPSEVTIKKSPGRPKKSFTKKG